MLTEHSRSEQAGLGLDRLSPAEHERFMATNAAYREKFGIPFVICVREHTKDSILANAEARVGNSREHEIETALGEIAKIAQPAAGGRAVSLLHPRARHAHGRPAAGVPIELRRDGELLASP